MKTLACGEIMTGCGATFEGETDDVILAQAGQHVIDVHDLDVTPELVEIVRSHIKDSSGDD
jgi:predicted small metal-binding protein